MNMRTGSSFVVFLLVAFLSACGGGGAAAPVAPSAPSIPAGLAAAGSRGNIHLDWSASSGGNMTGYNVYRSEDGTTFTKLNAAVVAGASYDDAIASPAGDGVFYTYRVTAVGDVESGPSGTARSIHGTRLAASYAAGFTTSAAASPYVTEGTAVVDGGNLVVATGTKLYVLDGGTLDIAQPNALIVNGLFRILASASSPATLTSHASGGALGPDQGFRLELNGCVDYADGGNNGTLLQNARITNLRSGNGGGDFHMAVEISACKPRLFNLKIDANNDSQFASMKFSSTSGVVVQHCSLTGLNPQIEGDQRATGFQMDHNNIAPGAFNYVLDLQSAAAGPINAGQIADNVFDSSVGQVDVAFITSGGFIPLGNNYWTPAVPTVRNQASTSAPDFNTALSSPPSGVGPTW